MKKLRLVLVFTALAVPAIANAQSTSEDQVAAPDVPSPAITVSGSAAIASDYRFRGLSQSDKEMAVQAGITVTHESGFYAGVWGPNLAGWGTFGGANMELEATYLRPSFSKGQDGTGSIAGRTFVVSLTAAF